MSRRLHTCIGTPRLHLEDLKLDIRDHGTTVWTINKDAKRGERVIIYMTSPVSAFVAVGVLVTDAWPEPQGSEWEGFWMAEVGELSWLPVPATRGELLSRIPAWRYMYSPIRSQVVDPRHVPELERMLNRTAPRRRAAGRRRRERARAGEGVEA